MKKGLETSIYSALGIVAMLGILVAFNFIAARGKQRIDLTEERANLAKLDGIEGPIRPTDGSICLGVSVSMLDQKEAIPFLAPNRGHHAAQAPGTGQRRHPGDQHPARTAACGQLRSRYGEPAARRRVVRNNG
jgi:hypothetical protein